MKNSFLLIRGLRLIAVVSWLHLACSLVPAAVYGGTDIPVRDIQQALRQHGHDPGPVDGIWGPRTSAALVDFQKKHGIVVTGKPDGKTLMLLVGQDDKASPNKQQPVLDPVSDLATDRNAGNRTTRSIDELMHPDGHVITNRSNQKIPAGNTAQAATLSEGATPRVVLATFVMILLFLLNPGLAVLVAITAGIAMILSDSTYHGLLPFGLSSSWNLLTASGIALSLMWLGRPVFSAKNVGGLIGGLLLMIIIGLVIGLPIFSLSFLLLGSHVYAAAVDSVLVFSAVLLSANAVAAVRRVRDELRARNRTSFSRPATTFSPPDRYLRSDAPSSTASSPIQIRR